MNVGAYLVTIRTYSPFPWDNNCRDNNIIQFIGSRTETPSLSIIVGWNNKIKSSFTVLDSPHWDYIIMSGAFFGAWSKNLFLFWCLSTYFTIIGLGNDSSIPYCYFKYAYEFLITAQSP